jgi:hypothetical protein
MEPALHNQLRQGALHRIPLLADEWLARAGGGSNLSYRRLGCALPSDRAVSTARLPGDVLTATRERVSRKGATHSGTSGGTQSSSGSRSWLCELANALLASPVSNRLTLPFPSSSISTSVCLRHSGHRMLCLLRFNATRAWANV